MRRLCLGRTADVMCRSWGFFKIQPRPHADKLNHCGSPLLRLDHMAASRTENTSVSSSSYLGIYFEEKPSCGGTRKMYVALIPRFYYGVACFSLYMLKPLDTVEHSAIRFITGDGFMTHHCQLYQDVSWTSLTLRRDQHCL